MPPRPRLYCGNAQNLPDGYTRMGTRFECLKKGYGAAMVYSTDQQRRNAVARMVERGPQRLTRDQLRTLALNVGVNPNRANGTQKTRAQLLDDITDALGDQ